MLCWSCQREITETAKLCPHCEAKVEDEPGPDILAAAEGILANMSPELINGLRDAFEKSTTGEEFVNRIMVGDCPKCGSSQTGDCEDDPDISDPCIGRCFACGQLWCCDCEEFFKDVQSTVHDCVAWEGMEDDA